MTSRRQMMAGAAALAAAAGGARTARAAGMTALRVAYIPILPMAQLFVIEAEGWARQAGLALHGTSFSSGPAMVQALASGRFDVAYIGIGPAMVAQAHGVDLRIVAANGEGQIALLGRGKLAGMWPHAASPAAAFAAFRKATGRKARIGSLPRGSVPDTVLRYWLDEVAHVPQDTVEVMGFGASALQQALLSGSLDAASTLEPTLTIVQERDKGARILVRGDTMFPGQPGAVLAVTSRLAHDNPAAVQTMVDLHVRATHFLRAHPHRAAADLAKTLGKGLIPEATLLQAVQSPSLNPVADPRRIIAATEKLNTYQAKIDHIGKVADVGAMFDTSYYLHAVKSAG
ncbi:ABC transporter substrate-binding protein [Acidiphilium sp. 20-67-58]|uniref:ABC transporter substrate-binding protein n=2 Tax=unclassified Acidiphilium TaxID=2617493 RepID=UPI0025C0E999|nr:ABC transporter substrate-binding protein [Acidiphilium sp. 20-67-58]